MVAGSVARHTPFGALMALYFRSTTCKKVFFARKAGSGRRPWAAKQQEGLLC